MVVGKLLEAKEYNYGYDAQTGEYGDLVKLGIIDPIQGRPYDPPGRRVDRGFDRHHRGDDHRTSKKIASKVSFGEWAPGPNGKMGQDKLPELLATQSRRNPLLLLTFRHFVPPRNGILDGVWRQQ